MLATITRRRVVYRRASSFSASLTGASRPNTSDSTHIKETPALRFMSEFYRRYSDGIAIGGFMLTFGAGTFFAGTKLYNAAVELEKERELREKEVKVVEEQVSKERELREKEVKLVAAQFKEQMASQKEQMASQKEQMMQQMASQKEQMLQQMASQKEQLVQRIAQLDKELGIAQSQLAEAKSRAARVP